jgi:hypothetical protein
VPPIEEAKLEKEQVKLQRVKCRLKILRSWLAMFSIYLKSPMMPHFSVFPMAD